MPPSDKNKSTGNSSAEKGQSQLCSGSCIMDFPSQSTSPSTSNVTLSGPGTIINIPWVTASQSTVKCSVNDQMKTFDPGEDIGLERLISSNGGNSVFLGKNSSLVKNGNKNYKAGSKINKLADMLAKRSQNMVEVKQNNLSTGIIVDISNTPKVEKETVISSSVSNIMESIDGSLFKNVTDNDKLNLYRKSRRKSVPNQSCGINQWQLQSTSKSCSDISELFPMEENVKLNALEGSMIKLQTDESTKKKVVKKNLRNVKLPLILPERKRRSSIKNDSLVSSKLLERVVEVTSVTPTEITNSKPEIPNESVTSSVHSPKPNGKDSKVKKEGKVKQRKSKRLVENSTQTADIEFISEIKPNPEVAKEKPATEGTDKPTITYECLYCTQTFTLGSLCKAHEKSHSFRNNKQFKCQYCSKKLYSLQEFKSHCVQKHPNKYAYCMKCDERFSTKDELYCHNREIHLNKIGENQSFFVKERQPVSPSQEKKQEETEDKTERKVTKSIPKPDLKIDVSFDSTKKSSVSPKNIQKFSPKETKTEEQLLEMEMLFYSHLSGNILENLTNHLDGKIDKTGNPVRTDQTVESLDNTKVSNLLSLTTSTGVPDVQVSRAPSPYQTRSKTPNPLPPTAKKFKKLPNWQQKFWEKYNFPTNYRLEHRFWDKNYLNSEKSAFYLKDLSCLDIKTQLTMRENIKKLDEIKKMEESLKPLDKLKFPDYLFLVPRENNASVAENKMDSQKNVSSECLKNKKQVGKEETKKSFKPPGSELPIVKNRSKIISETSDGKKQTPEGLKMMTRRQSSLESMKDDKDENSKKRKGSLDMGGSQRMSLRRQTSLDNSGTEKNAEKNDQVVESESNTADLENTPVSPAASAEISGEWIRPRSYLCGTCCTKFTNLWELEDHKWVSHPNVWCTHYEFEDEKIDKLFKKNEDEGTEYSGESSEASKSKLTDLYKRYLLPHGSLKTAKLVPKTNFPEQCTKCKKNCVNSSEMHKHMLDCGGDTTWFLTMYSSPMTIKRKWRPFGSRRKKQIGRRDVKRNIPSTPTLRSYQYQHRIRTKPGDVESIQKMLANLPEKRARRAINFDEIKTRSQATIHSNRLLRKRFKSSFSNNFLKLKTTKQKRQLKQKKREGSSKSTTDTSSENTPVGSPKRSNKLKESLNLLKEENSRDGSSETSEDVNIKIPKKKAQSTKKEAPEKSEGAKADKQKVKKEVWELIKEKPMTRSNGFILPMESKPKRKLSVKEEFLNERESTSISVFENKEQKFGKKTKRGSKIETTVKNKISEDASDAFTRKAKEILAREARKKPQADKASEMKTSSKKNSHWISASCNPILRLKQNNKAKTELLKNMQKKLKNSRKILEKKEVEKAEGGNRRSLRIRSLQQPENDLEIFDKQPVDSPKKMQTVTVEKDVKIKPVVVSLENAMISKLIRPPCGKNSKVDEQKAGNETPVTPTVRRSLRNSVSSEDKLEIPQNDSNTVPFNPRSLLNRNLRNEKNQCPSTVNKEMTLKTHRISNSEKIKAAGTSPLVTAQVSLLKKNRIQNNRPIRTFKLEDFSIAKKLESNENNDLEEMPILAKVEPIFGKVNKNQKDIPILMPVEKVQKNQEQHMNDSVSFQVIKKRRKNSKEITPLKIIKKVDTVENGNRVDESESTFLNDSQVVGKRKKKKFSDASTADIMEKQIKTDVKKYFLGIDPTEIDKGRNEGQDESGSDNEPLIRLTNYKQNEELSDFVTKEKKIEEAEETEELETPVLEATAEKSKTDLKNEIPGYPPTLASEVEIDKLSVPPEKIEEAKQIIKLKKTIKIDKKKKKTPAKTAKELRVTVTLKEPTIKIITKPETQNKQPTKMVKRPEIIEKFIMRLPTLEEVTPTAQPCILPQRRSRRISKETKLSSEFVIDDPLILVDELWSDLDSDSDSSKRKNKKGKKKTQKKKAAEENKTIVNLEELLRNFGENKETKKNEKTPTISTVIRVTKTRRKTPRSQAKIRQAVESRKTGKSYKRLSLKLFRFNKSHKTFGNGGIKLSDAKRALQQKLDEMQAKADDALPDFPFLAAEIKENPEQVIQCRAQKPKLAKKSLKKAEIKSQNGDIHLKVSLPLDIVNSMTVFNNNHLIEPILEEPNQHSPSVEEISQPEETPCPEGIEEEPLTEPQDASDLKNKSKRSEVIDKIFYCEICKTYYYSSSQLKIHKLSNRHKLKETELFESQKPFSRPESVKEEAVVVEPIPAVENAQKSKNIVNSEADRINDDTLDMPILEGPFIENPLTRVVSESAYLPPPPPVPSFGFSQESLKDIQKAIGCTDEEMLILTLLGENTIEIENSILDLDSYKSTQLKPSSGQKEKGERFLKENEKANGVFKVDLKQRMTSALACLVNKAVFNLLQKYETAAKSAVNSEALSLLGKLSNLSRRKNILQLNELLKKRNDGESSVGTLPKDLDKKEPTISYKYQCTICGSRFEKASTRECHISRSHKGKAKKHMETQAVQAAHEDEWNDSWNYDAGEEHLGSTNTSQFWCSDCGINFLSPQEVLDHQKLEHQVAQKEPEQNKDFGPLQSSTIGSSDEILEGKKSRRRPKLFSSEELDQQRIIANNELRKLDRKFSNKNKSNKIKWGMDALKFTVEKENKIVVEEEDKEVTPEEPLKPGVDVKNIDLVPKLNLSRISNIPEFKVIQKNSFENRFQKIIDNKLKRKCSCPSQEENAADEIEEEVMLVPVVVKKKNKKQKVFKCSLKKQELEKSLDVYEFNESESEGEPAVYSHIKKQTPSPTKLKLVKVKERPSKNKADSTTKDLAPDDYDSEDSLPLSIVKKSKPGEEDDEKNEKTSEADEGTDKPDGILEQVEYLIEQLENETGSSGKEKADAKEIKFESEVEKDKILELSKEDSVNAIFKAGESLRLSVGNKYLELEELHLKNVKIDESNDRKTELSEEQKTEEQDNDFILAEPESNQSTFDEEDSIPLVLISKKTEKSKFNLEEKKCDENTTDVSTTASEDVSLHRTEENKGREPRNSPTNTQGAAEQSLLPVFSSSENEGGNLSEKSTDKTFEILNGNVIYCRNDSISDFESDISSDGLIDSNFEKNNSRESNKSFIKEIQEKEDVVIVCSKGVESESNECKTSGRLKNMENSLKKKKRFPLLTATIKENNFRKSESLKSNKEVIVRKIWSRKKLAEESTEDEDDFYDSLDDNNTSAENLLEDDSQTEIEKEMIVKKIWSRKKHEFEEFPEKVEEKFVDIKINQTEISDEVVIKCGPKAKSSPKRRKSRSSANEDSKDTIMRKIWSGRCFQTKAALKTYESDVLPNCKENDNSGSQSKTKRRKRPTSFSSAKRSKVESEAEKDDDDDDLDSLLEEIEREQLEKAIRTEFLQLRRSEKANVEMKEVATPGLFTETTLNFRKEVSDKKRRKVKKKLKHPRQSLLKRKKLIRKPFRRVLPDEERNFSESTNRTNLEGSIGHSENSVDKNIESFDAESKPKNRKHKKHRHKHHHHKHKHKKSKHHKSESISKHKSKHEFVEKEEEAENPDSFTILEKICQDIPNQIENETHFISRTSQKRLSLDVSVADPKVSDAFPSFENKTNPEIEFENEISEDKRFENIYEFMDDIPDFSPERISNLKK